jgi:hypothetical protein
MTCRFSTDDVEEKAEALYHGHVRSLTRLRHMRIADIDGSLAVYSPVTGLFYPLDYAKVSWFEKELWCKKALISMRKPL